MNKIEQIVNSDFVITLGTMLADNKEEFRNSLIKAIAKNDTYFVYMHPIDNIDLKLYYNQFIKYEVGSEEGICAMLLDTFAKNCSPKVKSYLDDLDLGYISAESSAGEEEFEEAFENSKNTSNQALVIGDDIIEHKRVENIIKLLSAIKKYTSLNLIILDEILAQKVASCDDEDIEEIEELKSYNGTLVYKLIDDDEKDELLVSQTFANIAKVKNKDKVSIKTQKDNLEKILKVDDRLNGTIAVLKTRDDILDGYRYKQVKIQKLD